MNYKELARKIRAGYQSLKEDEGYKFYHIIWNRKLETSEIRVENDAQFKAIIIGNTKNSPDSKGYMYLFYTDDRSVPFPTIKEIERRLRIVARKEPLPDKDACYFDRDEYGPLEMQRSYFAGIIRNALKEGAMERQNKSSELEFTDAMLERVDEMEHAIYQMCNTLLHAEDDKDSENQLSWNVEILEEVKELVIWILRKHQYKVCEPYIKIDGEEQEYCRTEECGFTNCNRHP